jgi:hypothetical protein
MPTLTNPEHMFRYKRMQHPLVSVIAPVHKQMFAILYDEYYQCQDHRSVCDECDDCLCSGEDISQLSLEEFEDIHLQPMTIDRFLDSEPHLYPLPPTDLKGMKIRYAGLGFGEDSPYQLDRLLQDDPETGELLDNDEIIEVVRNFKYYRFDVTGIPDTTRSKIRLENTIQSGWCDEICLYEDEYWYVYAGRPLTDLSLQQASTRLREFIHECINGKR